MRFTSSIKNESPRIKRVLWHATRVRWRYKGITPRASYLNVVVARRERVYISKFTVSDYFNGIWNSSSADNSHKEYNGCSLFIAMDLHSIIARRIVRSIAKMHGYDEIQTLKKSGFDDEEIKKIHFDVRQSACYDIVCKGYSDPIFDDICNEIATDLYNMYIDGGCDFHIEDGRMVADFETYVNKRGVEKSQYFKLYNSVSHVLARNSNNNHRIGGKMIVCDSIGVRFDDDGAVLGQYNVNKSSPMYVSSVAFHDSFRVISDLKVYDEFRRLVYSDLSMRKALNTMVVYNGLLQGMKSDEIVQYSGLSIDVVKKARADIKKIYEKHRYELGLVKYRLRNADVMSLSEFMRRISDGARVVDKRDSANVSDRHVFLLDEYTTWHDSHDCTCADVEKSDIKTIAKGVNGVDIVPTTYTDYTPTVGSMVFSDGIQVVEADNRDFASDSTVEIIKNGDNFDVYYVNKIDISHDSYIGNNSNDSKKRINRVYIHSVPMK